MQPEDTGDGDDRADELRAAVETLADDVGVDVEGERREAVEDRIDRLTDAGKATDMDEDERTAMAAVVLGERDETATRNIVDETEIDLQNLLDARQQLNEATEPGSYEGESEGLET